MKIKKLLTGIVLALPLVAAPCLAEIAVIVHPGNTNNLDTDTIKFIYLGKKKSFPNGDEAVPISQADSSAPTGEFNEKVLNKNASQLKAYWSKLVFTGKGTPPKAVNSDSEVVSLVSSNPNIIGYVDAASVDSSVKVVATF